MKIEDKVGTLFMVGFEGKSPSALLEGLIREERIGGVILLGRNLEDASQVKDLCAQLQAIRAEGSPLPLLIAIDQEGGAYSRFKRGISAQPSAVDLGKAGREETACEAGKATALQLKSMGININFAPVLDLFTNPGNPFLAQRSFGTDPQGVARMGCAFIKGTQEAGMSATAKHFPGLGEAILDPHERLPTVEMPRETLLKRELFPFSEAIRAKVDLIMTAHAIFPSLQGDESLPASLSPAIGIDLLRRAMGFSGLIVTDDLSMGAIKAHYDLMEASWRALMGGADIILICHDLDRQKEVIKGLQQEASRKPPLRERAEESSERVFALRKKHLFRNPNVKIQNPNY